MTDIFAAIVYSLCALSSATCAWLLWRSYRGLRTRLLLWASLCFALLSLNNLTLVFDRVLWTGLDFRMVRTWLSLAAICSLMWAFVWEIEEEK